MLDAVTASSFKDLVGSNVTVVVMDGPNLVLTLDKVLPTPKKKGSSAPEGGRGDAFSLILSGPDYQQVPDGTYNIDFGALGVMSGVYLDNKADHSDEEDGEPDQVPNAMLALVAASSDKAAPAADDATSDPTALPEPVAKRVQYEIVFS